MSVKFESHELIVLVKEMYLETGKIPTRNEFKFKIKGGEYWVSKYFGNFGAFLIAAGITDVREKSTKITNNIFNRDIEAHIEAHLPPEFVPYVYPNCAILSDIHWPFSLKRVVDTFLAYIEANQPEWVILNGDAWDMYSHAKFPRSHNIFTPREEERLARELNIAFWADVRKRCPNAKCVQMLGNHDVRPLKRVLEAVPTMEDWVQDHFTKIFSFEGVKTIFDPREELYLNDTSIVFHGYRGQLGAHRDYTLMNCFNGHTHRGGVVYRQVRGNVLFEANSGYAGDPTAKGLTYTPQRITGWTHGFTVCDKWGPRFITA